MHSLVLPMFNEKFREGTLEKENPRAPPLRPVFVRGL